MSAKHTPGPWEVDDLAITGPHSEAIASVFDACEFPCYDEDDHAALEAEVVANARLIAAAPDMLEALEAVHKLSLIIDSAVRWSESNERHGGQTSAALTAARAAISKARGEVLETTR